MDKLKTIHRIENPHDLGYCTGDHCPVSTNCKLLVRARRKSLGQRWMPYLRLEVEKDGALVILCRSFDTGNLRGGQKRCQKTRRAQQS